MFLLGEEEREDGVITEELIRDIAESRPALGAAMLRTEGAAAGNTPLEEEDGDGRNLRDFPSQNVEIMSSFFIKPRTTSFSSSR